MKGNLVPPARLTLLMGIVALIVGATGSAHAASTNFVYDFLVSGTTPANPPWIPNSGAPSTTNLFGGGLRFTDASTGYFWYQSGSLSSGLLNSNSEWEIRGRYRMPSYSASPAR